MKILKTLILASILLACGMNASAENKNNLVYNSEEVNGMMVGQTVYKMTDGTLANYMKYSYKYDDQQRMIENDSQKWNSTSNDWENDVRICYAYQGKSITTTYYKWNKKKGEYILVPEMTVTMDNPDM